jgi:hypothetical protein
MGEGYSAMPSTDLRAYADPAFSLKELHSAIDRFD